MDKTLNTQFTPFPVLKTERLVLRQLSITDDQEIFALRSSSEINKYLDRQPSKTIEDARAFINKVNENAHKNLAVYWAITLNDTNTLIGTICLFGFSEQDGKCEIGFELSMKFQGQGLMKEALEKVISYAFDSIKVRSIEAFVHHKNQSSVSLLERSSFKKSADSDEANPDLLAYYLTN